MDGHLRTWDKVSTQTTAGSLAADSRTLRASPRFNIWCSTFTVRRYPIYRVHRHIISRINSRCSRPSYCTVLTPTCDSAGCYKPASTLCKFCSAAILLLLVSFFSVIPLHVVRFTLGGHLTSELISLFLLPSGNVSYTCSSPTYILFYR